VVLKPSTVLEVATRWVGVSASDLARQEQEQAEESRRGLQLWMDSALSAAPLYPPHPLTQPHYTPTSCPLHANCLHALEQRAEADAASRSHRANSHSSPYKPSGTSKLSAAAGGFISRSKRQVGRSSGEPGDDDEPMPTARNTTAGKKRAAAPGASSSSSKRKTTVRAKQVYAAGELGPPKTSRSRASAAGAAVSGDDGASHPSNPSSSQPSFASFDLAEEVDTGIREEGEGEEEEEEQTQAQPEQPRTEASVEGTRVMHTEEGDEVAAASHAHD
jgi:hypothetical protein